MAQRARCALIGLLVCALALRLGGMICPQEGNAFDVAFLLLVSTAGFIFLRPSPQSRVSTVLLWCVIAPGTGISVALIIMAFIYRYLDFSAFTGIFALIVAIQLVVEIVRFRLASRQRDSL